MTVAISLAWVTAGAARPAPKPPARRRRYVSDVDPGFKLLTLWAISCVICETIGPLATSRERGMTPALRWGFRWRRIGEVSGWLCAECLWKYEAMRPPPTREHCVDGPRPCRALFCRYHLAFDVSRKASDDFALEETCALDIADKGPHTLREVGAILGMTREGSRGVEVIALEKLRGIPGIAFDFEDDEDER